MQHFLPVLAAISFTCILGGCSNTPKYPDVSDNVRKSLDRAGFKDVSVKDDRDKGVVTLNGHVGAETDKSEAEGIAKSLAAGQVVADQVAVIPQGNEKEANSINSDLDKGIENNLDAALKANHLDKTVKCSVKNRVVTLTGDVDSQGRRTQAATIAAAVPNVQQVVNELQVKDQRATSSN